MVHIKKKSFQKRKHSLKKLEETGVEMMRPSYTTDFL